MRRDDRWWLPGLVAAVALAIAAPARAQQKVPYREGFWIGVGLGYGSASISCTGCVSNSRYGAATLTLRMGGTLSKQLLLGGELNAWSRSESGVTETVGDVSAVLLFYPSLSTPLFLKGGVGVVVYNANSSPTLESEGLGVNVGVGYDLYTGRKFSITPFASYVTAVSGNLKIAGTDTGFAVKPNLLEVGVAATWH